LALSEQIHIYSLDTGDFYYKNERKLHNIIYKLKSERNKLKNEMKSINEKLNFYGYNEEIEEMINKNDYSFIPEDQEYRYIGYNIIELLNRKDNIERYLEHKKLLIESSKDKLLQILEYRCDYNQYYNKEFNHSYQMRVLKEKSLNIKNIISVFESTFTRTVGLKTNDLSTDIMVVQVYYFDVIKDMILHGFIYNGEKYRFFTSSAGQIRTKKTVFIKESVWNRHIKTLLCGLTIEKINELGGINVNKYLAYLALTNSATDLWKDFDINKTIVVEDFETNVTGEVDLIDDLTYTIERKTMPVPITHTDGSGMMLPSISKKNFMCRLPWVKGLLATFDFKKFILEQNELHPEIKHEMVKDIYGKEHNILEEDIKIIFTKSQFKMYKYYESWNEYQKYFSENKCQAGICNLEEDNIKKSKINYQMIQTLTDMTDDELVDIAFKSSNKIVNLSSTVDSMLNAFGVTKYNKNKTYLQQALEIYPELLRDIYTKDVLRQIKLSLIKDYKSAKLEIDGKYTFLIPDMYAFCENLFCGIKEPVGLLQNNEVYCNLYKKVEKLDCLRSPHLYREHAVRNNVIDDEKSKWFITDAIYTSCHDLISKILQFDVDGDRSLVVAEKSIVQIAERNMRDIVPLYYNMRKADPVILTNEQIYNGLNAAYTGGNIGAISNDITKIWNSGIITDEKMKAIKLLCMENNFTIDYAKTLYKPKRPIEIKKIITKYTKKKVPYFFIYAKDKELSQIESKNDSIVNKLDDIIINKKMNFSINKFGKFNYTMLMNNSQIKLSEELINKYNELNRTYHFKINMEDENKGNISYIALEIRDELSKFKYSEYEICDMLVKYLYDEKNSKSKESLWFCYGKIIVENLKRNIGDKDGVCGKCGKRFKKKQNYHKYCNDCAKYIPKKTKNIKCIDCGCDIITSACDMKTIRCKKCQKIKDKENTRLRVQKYRNNKEM
jgi:hypothetical protein